MQHVCAQSDEAPAAMRSSPNGVTVLVKKKLHEIKPRSPQMLHLSPGSESPGASTPQVRGAASAQGGMSPLPPKFPKDISSTMIEPHSEVPMRKVHLANQSFDFDVGAATNPDRASQVDAKAQGPGCTRDLAAEYDHRDVVPPGQVVKVPASTNPTASPADEAKAAELSASPLKDMEVAQYKEQAEQVAKELATELSTSAKEKEIMQYKLLGTQYKEQLAKELELRKASPESQERTNHIKTVELAVYLCLC